MNIIKNKVLVIGGDHHNTLGVVRSLGEKGIKTYIIIAGRENLNKPLRNSFVLQSKFVKKGWILTSYNDIYNFLIEEFSNELYKPIIICTSDASINQIDIHYNELKESFYIPNANRQEEISNLINKHIMSDLAIKSGLIVAKSWLVDKTSKLSDVEFPCITKHLNSVIGPKTDMYICNNTNELMSFLHTKDSSQRFIVQKFIEKDFEYQLIGCSIDGGKELIIPGYTEILRSNYNSNTGLLSYKSIDKISIDMNSIKRFFVETGYSGLFSMEFIRGKDCKDYFLETNFRNDGNAYAVTASGINLPYIWVLACIGIDYNEEKNKIAKELISMPEFDDLIHVLKRNISLCRWLKDLKKANILIYYSKNDKKPFYYQLKCYLIIILKRIIKLR